MGHVDDHNDLMKRILEQAARLKIPVDVGGPWVEGDPGHIIAHNKTRQALISLAQAVQLSPPLPDIHSLADSGHISDHGLMAKAIKDIEEGIVPDLAVSHTGYRTFTIVEYDPRIDYRLDGEVADRDGATITFSQQGWVILHIGNADVGQKIEVRDYTYHNESRPQFCYNPCGNCRTDVNPHTWGCGCGSPCGDSGGGQWGDCVCRGPDVQERVKDPTPAGFEDSFGEWAQITDLNPKGTPQAVAPLQGQHLDLWIDLGGKEFPDVTYDELLFYRGKDLVGMYSTTVAGLELSFAQYAGSVWLRAVVDADWLTPDLSYTYRASTPKAKILKEGALA